MYDWDTWATKNSPQISCLGLQGQVGITLETGLCHSAYQLFLKSKPVWSVSQRQITRSEGFFPLTLSTLEAAFLSDVPALFEVQKTNANFGLITYGKLTCFVS